jgi:hypothetical protein
MFFKFMATKFEALKANVSVFNAQKCEVGNIFVTNVANQTYKFVKIVGKYLQDESLPFNSRTNKRRYSIDYLNKEGEVILHKDNVATSKLRSLLGVKESEEAKALRKQEEALKEAKKQAKAKAKKQAKK